MVQGTRQKSMAGKLKMKFNISASALDRNEEMIHMKIMVKAFAWIAVKRVQKYLIIQLGLPLWLGFVHNWGVLNRTVQILKRKGTSLGVSAGRKSEFWYYFVYWR